MTWTTDKGVKLSIVPNGTGFKELNYFTKEENDLIKPLCLITSKPAMYVANVSDSGFSFIDWSRLFALTYITLLYDDISLLLIPSHMSHSARFQHLNFKEG